MNYYLFAKFHSILLIILVHHWHLKAVIIKFANSIVVNYLIIATFFTRFTLFSLNFFRRKFVFTITYFNYCYQFSLALNLIEMIIFKDLLLINLEIRYNAAHRTFIKIKESFYLFQHQLMENVADLRNQYYLSNLNYFINLFNLAERLSL